MRYEELSLRPVTGSIDHDAITAWLVARDHVFLHHWEFPIWHLCWDAADVAYARDMFSRELPQFGYGAMVILFPDHVSMPGDVRFEHSSSSAGSFALGTGW